MVITDTFFSANLPTSKDYFEFNEFFTDSQGNRFNTYYTPPSDDESPVFIFHHGAGSSALTFALLAKSIRAEMSKVDKTKVAGVFAFDARGHGQTIIKSNPENFSLKSFTDDFIFVIRELVSKENLKRSLIVVGHSLGGAILTNAVPQLGDLDIKGLGMFDIVEDTAIHSLGCMEAYLNNLPKSFGTISDAINWHLKTGHLRNKESAEISVPSYFYENETTGTFEWIADLHKTENYWHDWFVGLSKNFVNAPTSKLLILAGTDNLDKELMIGQMQGKYQLVVFQDSGHFIQEDTPLKTAITLIDFWKRNDRKQVVIKSTWGSKK